MGQFPDRQPRRGQLTWSDLRKRYQGDRCPQLSPGAQGLWRTAANHCERIVRPRWVVDLDKAAFARFGSELLREGLAPASVASYQRAVRSALGWAHDLDLIESVPKVKSARGDGRVSTMRGRPVNGEEFERILMAVPRVRPRDAAQWDYFLRGLRLSSLRVSEARNLSWDVGAPLSIDCTGQYPLIKMLAEGHKSRRDLFVPISRAFWDLINRVGDRNGYVLPVVSRAGNQIQSEQIVKVVARLGRAAGVIVDPNSGRTATSHNIGRQSFLSDLATRKTTSETAEWARHRSPQTTSTYYIRHTAEALAVSEGWG